MRRLFSSSSPAHGRHTLPILRLPTTLFPHQCFSLSLEPPELERSYSSAILEAAKRAHRRLSDQGFQPSDTGV